MTEAELIRHEQGLGNGHVDLFALAETLGVCLVCVPWPEASVEGKYARRHGRAFIFLNTVHPVLRQRFTLAHELGHHVLATGDHDVDYTDNAKSLRSRAGEERQVNLFASALLMDAHGVSTAVRGMSVEEAVAEVARTFEVSPDAATIRLGELSLVDATTVANLMDALKDPDERRRFKRTHHLFGPDSSSSDLRFPAGYVDRVDRLRSAGILSPERVKELMERPRPSVVRS